VVLGSGVYGLSEGGIERGRGCSAADLNQLRQTSEQSPPNAVLSHGQDGTKTTH
jgi:hypothetical protein